MTKDVNYNIGLDIGTNSVGWVVTNENDDILKYTIHSKNNKRKCMHQMMWGSLLFDEGISAKDRRLFRSTRRRMDRRKERINILNQLFNDEMCKVDPLFFRKLEESNLWLEDRKYTDKLGLFDDEKEYYKNYPTIYHLRNKLCETTGKIDIRYIYLAIHHIIKYRGNFLYENQKFNVKSINLNEQFAILFDDFNMDIEINENGIKSLMTDETLRKKQKKEGMVKEIKYDNSNKKLVENICSLLVGLSGDITKIFDLEELSEEENKKLKSVNFTDKYEDSEDDIKELLGDNAYILDHIHDIYTSLFLINMFGDMENPSISQLMINRYDKHKADLKKLKKTLLEKDKNIYDKFFKDTTIGRNYETYIRNTSSYNYEEVKKDIIVMIQGTSQESEIKIDLENDNFLRKLNIVENGNFPYQLNMDELEKIINNQKQYYPFLGDTIESEGKEVYKLVKLLTFRIPYYVGPIVSHSLLNDNEYKWFVRKDENSTIRITPFNFENEVDYNKSAEKFITRMTNYCTYLPKEKVMPKNSLLYSEFCVLNELKQISFNGDKSRRLSVDNIKKIVNGLFKIHGGKITDRVFKTYLIKENLVPDLDYNTVIDGYQTEKAFASSMKSYVDFKYIFDNVDDYETIKKIERIIEWITIYEDKKILKSRLNSEFPELTDEQVSKILSLKYTGWSRLSKEFLTNTKIGYVTSTGEYQNIITLMRETKENFMQILNDSKYKIQDQINAIVYKDKKDEITYDDIDDLACSPAVKKDIWQSILLVKEITKLIGKNPQHIFIEMAREEGKKVRTTNRVKHLEDLYNKIKKDVCEYNKDNSMVLKELASRKKHNDKIDDERLYLYFLQQGKCMYSGRTLNINDLSDYEVDHIIPRSLVTDNSIENKALVFKDCNQRKTDGTIPEYVQRKQQSWWLYLREHNFITSKKYNSLMLKELNSDAINGFINRQLVETRQITKNVANLMNAWFGDDCSCLIRANVSHDFREKNEMYKYREMNNLHHAHDAYLAASLGNYLLKIHPETTKYSDYKYVYDKNKKQSYSYGHIIDNISKEKTNQICNYLYYNNPLVVKKTEIQSGQLYGKKMYPNPINKEIKGYTKTPNEDKLIPTSKKFDVHRYGGYSNAEKSYFDLIEYKDDDNIVHKIVPILMKYKNASSDKVEEYIKDELGYKNAVILKDKIGKYQLIEFKKQRFYMSSDKELVNAVELKFSKKDQIEYKKLLNYICNNKIYKDDEGNELPYDIEKIDSLINLILEKMHDDYNYYISELKKIKENLEKIGLDNIKLEDKKKLVHQLFLVLKADAVNANLGFLNQDDNASNFSKRIGRIQFKKSISSGKIIFTSLTGLKTNEIVIGEDE